MAKNIDAWMPIWIGDYLADTTYLTREQHGAYFLLMMAYWRSRQAIPDDDARLASIVKASLVEWKRLRPVMAEFFSINNGVWFHKRIEAELSKAQEKSVKASSKAKAAAEARWANASSDATSKASVTANRMHEDCPSPSPSPSPTGGSNHMLYAEMAVALRKQGVSVTSAHPALVAWVQDGFTVKQLLEAVEVARLSKPPPANIPANYLDKVVRSAPTQGTGRHEQRAKTIEGLTGTAAGQSGRVIEVAAKRVG